MRFEVLPPGAAEGAILVHGVRTGARMLKKGRILTTEDVAALSAGGVSQVTVVRLEPDDVGEDEAASRIGHALGGQNIRLGAAFTGRANLYAEEAGLVLLDDKAIDAANATDEAVTVATLPEFAPVSPGDMVATVKIIPFAAPKRAVDAVTAIAGKAPIAVAPFRPLLSALVVTHLPGHKATEGKTRAALDARLAAVGGKVVFEKQCSHDPASVAAALREAEAQGAGAFFIMGASAIADRRDVVPAAIEAAGGRVIHFGMPVDPGNLLLLGDLDGKPAVGLPGCARSPKLNGFDFVLHRLAARIPIARADITAMGVGGLLNEIGSRPQPRAGEVPEPPRAPRIAAVVLAAGLSSRMGSNKLLAAIEGEPLLRHTVRAALQSQARPVMVVTGHEAARVEESLAGLGIAFVRNPDYAQGLSTSLRAGIKAVPETCDGALVLLGDMPELGPKVINRMMAAFSPADGRTVCVASANGKRGNPVLWGRRHFEEIEALSGDIGAKHLVSEHEESVCEIEADASAFSDVDTPEALEALRARTAAKVPT